MKKMLRRIFPGRRTPPRHHRHLTRRPDRCAEPLEERRLLAASLSVSIDAPVSVPENGVQNMVVTLSRDESQAALAVPFEITGNASFGVDYLAGEIRPNSLWLPEAEGEGGRTLGTAFFAPGESEVEIEFDPLFDLEQEFTEDIVLTLLDSPEFGPVTGAASLIQRREDTQYFAVDEANRLARLDIHSGAVEIIGAINSTQTIRDLAFTEDGNLFAISFDHLFELDLETISDGLIGTRFLGFHGIPAASALVDARDEDFDSEAGDLFAVGDGRLLLQQLDLEIINNQWELNAVFPVFDIEQELADRSFPSQFRTPGDLDYSSSGDLILSAALPDAESDSLIQIQTPGNLGLIDVLPVPSQDPGRPFKGLQGLAFDGRDSIAIAGNVGLTINQFNLDANVSFDLIGRPYELSDEISVSGRIEGDPVAPPVISLTTLATDPADLPGSPQPTSWIVQRSDLHDIVIDLGAPIAGVDHSAIRMTNLGLSPQDAPVPLMLREDQVVLSASGTRITITLDAGQLPDGRYQLDLPTEITRGDPLTFLGSPLNRFFVLRGDWDGNGVIDLRDVRTIAYWYDNDVPVAPDYVDLDRSGVIDQGDLDLLSLDLGRFIATPGFPSPVDPDFQVRQPFDAALRSAANRLDVNGSGAVTPLDALQVLNRLGGGFTTELDWRYDVNRDGNISPIDALRVLNAIAQQGVPGSPAAEAELPAEPVGQPLGFPVSDYPFSGGSVSGGSVSRDSARSLQSDHCDAWFALQGRSLPF